MRLIERLAVQNKFQQFQFILVYIPPMVAQIIGKPALAPAAWVRRLVTQCDQSPATPYDVIQVVLEKELGQSVDGLFERFEVNPLGSASITQLKPKHPDFKHKDSGVPLWLNTAPKWVLSGLDGLEFDVPLLNVKQAKASKDGQYESIVQDIENMVRSYIGKGIMGEHPHLGRNA